MNIYNKEILELEIDIFTKIKLELENIVNNKINRYSKASYELKNIITELDFKIKNMYKKYDEQNINELFSVIKIEKDTFEILINLKYKLDCDSISKLLKILALNYENFFLTDSYLQIKHLELNNSTQIFLNNTDLYLCEVIDNFNEIESNRKAIYKIDDVKLFDNQEYLDIKNFKKYPVGKNIIWISLKCTLEDIEKLDSLSSNIFI